MGPAWWKKYSSLVLPMIKPDQRRRVCLLFPPVDTKNCTCSDSKSFCTRPRRHYTTIYGLSTGLPPITTLSIRVGYSDTQLGHSTPVHRLARTERESIRQSVTLPAIARVCCGRSASASCATQTKQIRVLAGMNRTRRSKRVSLLT